MVKSEIILDFHTANTTSSPRLIYNTLALVTLNTLYYCIHPTGTLPTVSEGHSHMKSNTSHLKHFVKHFCIKTKPKPNYCGTSGKLALVV